MLGLFLRERVAAVDLRQPVLLVDLFGYKLAY